jgi:hypothetical protein
MVVNTITGITWFTPVIRAHIRQKPDVRTYTLIVTEGTFYTSAQETKDA